MATKTTSTKAKATTKKDAKPAAKPKAVTKPKAVKGETKRPTEQPDAPKQYDPSKCATPRCKGEPALTHLGKPLCQKCWQRQCATESEGAKAAQDLVGETPAPDGPATEAAAPATTPEATKPKAKRTRKPAAEAGEAKPKRVSAIDAAADVLQRSAQAMNSKEMIAAMQTLGLWTSPAGKTPHATLYSAILREIGTKGATARFRKTERGKFQFNTPVSAATA